MLREDEGRKVRGLARKRLLSKASDTTGSESKP